MDVRFVPPDLRKLDAFKTEAISIPFFSDERPLRGALGLVDWRLCGQVSRLLVRGHISGDLHETVLIPARPKLSFDKLFLFGLGPRASFDEARFSACLESMLSALTRARVRTSVLVLPGRAFHLIAPDRAMELFLGIASSHVEHDEVTLVEDNDAQKAMTPVVEREKRRARAIAV